MSYQDYNQMPPQVYGPQTSSKAIISLVAGIASYMLLPLIAAIVAIIAGGSAKKEIRASNGRLTGEGMATAGQILGWINIGISVIGLCILGLTLAGVALPACIIPFTNNF